MKQWGIGSGLEEPHVYFQCDRMGKSGYERVKGRTEMHTIETDQINSNGDSRWGKGGE